MLVAWVGPLRNCRCYKYCFVRLFTFDAEVAEAAQSRRRRAVLQNLPLPAVSVLISKGALSVKSGCFNVSSSPFSFLFPFPFHRYLRPGGYVFIAVCVSVCMCVCVYLKKSWTEFDEIFWGVGRGQGTIDLISVAIRIFFTTLPEFFTSVMHFQLDSNSLLLFARWHH